MELQTGDKTPSFKPNTLDGTDLQTVKHQFLGQIYKANYNRLVSTDICAVVWEASCFMLLSESVQLFWCF